MPVGAEARYLRLSRVPNPRRRFYTKMKKTYFPEAYTLRMPEGYRSQIEAAARDSGMTPAEWIRRAVTRALDAHRKSRRGEA